LLGSQPPVRPRLFAEELKRQAGPNKGGGQRGNKNASKNKNDLVYDKPGRFPQKETRERIAIKAGAAEYSGA
jgi:hypothetical protein